MTRSDIASRSEIAVASVLPPSVQVRRRREDGHSVDLELNGQPVRVRWLGEGGLRQARELIAGLRELPDIAAARRLSPGARKALSTAGVGWVDETGAAEIASGTLIVSRTGRIPVAPRKPPHWTPSVLAVAEALLCGGRATVSAMQETTNLSAGSTTNALRTLTDLEFLNAEARRGPKSARQVPDSDRLLDSYAIAAAALMPTITLTVGITGRDLVAGLGEIGRRWDKANMPWAVTAVAAASVFAPYLTTLTTAEVYVHRKTLPGLEAVATIAGLQPIEGGRLTLRPFPTVTTRSLAVVTSGLNLAPWPRVYADLRGVGVRGEEAAEHLREVVRAR